jgi:hypothetical protein
MVHGAHSFGLQIYAGSFESGRGGEMVGGFSQGRHLLGLGSIRGPVCHRIQFCFMLYLSIFAKKRKKMEKWPG